MHLRSDSSSLTVPDMLAFGASAGPHNNSSYMKRHSSSSICITGVASYLAGTNWQYVSLGRQHTRYLRYLLPASTVPTSFPQPVHKVQRPIRSSIAAKRPMCSIEWLALPPLCCTRSLLAASGWIIVARGWIVVKAQLGCIRPCRFSPAPPPSLTLNMSPILGRVACE